MKNILVLIFTIFSNTSLLNAHCQIPCGIYDDNARILSMIEDFKTIDKAMIKIKELSNDQDALSKNQLTRWIETKDKHASNIQNTVSTYFLSQRIKESNKNYFNQMNVLHKILVTAMKCKQTLDNENFKTGLDLIDLFSKIYLDSDQLQRLKEYNK